MVIFSFLGYLCEIESDSQTVWICIYMHYYCATVSTSNVSSLKLPWLTRLLQKALRVSAFGYPSSQLQTIESKCQLRNARVVPNQYQDKTGKQPVRVPPVHRNDKSQHTCHQIENMENGWMSKPLAGTLDTTALPIGMQVRIHYNQVPGMRTFTCPQSQKVTFGSSC